MIRWAHPLAVLLALLLCASASAADRQRLAVLELRGPLSPDIQAFLTDAVRKTAVDVVPAESYLVLSRENLAAILTDMGLDADCVEGECEVETGRNIGAAYVASGAVVELDGTLLATLKIFATQDGALLASEQARAGSALELIDQLKPAATRLFSTGLVLERQVDGRIGEVGRSVDLGGAQRAVVAFESIPKGAVVLVDGALVCASTPCSREVAVGQRRVEMQLEQHRAVQQTFDPSRRASLSLELAPRFATLTIETEPKGLAFTIDGEMPTGDGPVRLAPGAHEILAADRCFLAQGERVTLEEGATRTVRLQPEARRAGLAVSAADGEGNALAASVTVDGVSKGTTPMRVEVPLCSEFVEVVDGPRRDGHALSLVEGRVSEVKAVLHRRKARSPRHPWGTSSGQDEHPRHPVATTKMRSVRLGWDRRFEVFQFDERIVLDGKKRTAMLAIEVPSTAYDRAADTPLRVTSSVGRITRVRWNARISMFEAELELPKTPFPQLALLAIWDERDAVDSTSFAAVKLWAGVDYPVATRRPGVEIELEIGGRGYGPVAADGSGRASIPIQVAPGESVAHATLTDSSGASSRLSIDLQTPPSARVAFGPARWTEGYLQVALMVVDPTGNAPAAENPQIEVPGCSSPFVSRHPDKPNGEISCSAAQVPAEGATVRAWLPGEEKHAAEAVVEVVP